MNHSGQMTGAAQQGYVAGTSAIGQESVRMGEIPHALERLERTLKGCCQGLDTLASKLESSVMRSEPPSPIGNKTDPTPVPNTPYGSRLHEFVSVAAMINDRIQSLNQRLEV